MNWCIPGTRVRWLINLLVRKVNRNGWIRCGIVLGYRSGSG
jgi:hypothetical protein